MFKTFARVFSCTIKFNYPDSRPIPSFSLVEGSYGINATSNDVDGIKYQGGNSFAAGLGLKILFQENTGFVIGAGYRF